MRVCFLKKFFKYPSVNDGFALRMGPDLIRPRTFWRFAPGIAGSLIWKAKEYRRAGTMGFRHCRLILAFNHSPQNYISMLLRRAL